MEELNNNITDSEITTETTVENKTEIEEPYTKTYKNEEEYKKEIQSISSKAKNDLLKKLGISNVDDYKASKEKYETLASENEELKKTIKNKDMDILYAKLGIDDDNKEDFEALFKVKIKEDTTSDELLAIGKEIKEKYFQKSKGFTKVGTEKTNSSSIPEVDGVTKKFLELNPRLKF